MDEMTLFDSHLLTMSGLGLDIIGVLWLIKSRIIPDEAIQEMAMDGWGLNETVRRSLRQQRRNAIVGGTLMLLGFALQIIGNWLSMPH